LKNFLKAEVNDRPLTTRDLFALFIFGAFVLFLLAVFFLPERHDHGPISRRAACLSQLKSVGLNLEIYASDNDGYLPPFDTTDPSGKEQELFVRALTEDIGRPGWFCPDVPKSLRGGRFTGLEGTGATTYVHAEEYRRHRLRVGSFGMSFIPDPANLPYLRDPIKSIEDDEGTLLIKSGHGLKFNLLFADGHARGVQMNRNGLSFPKKTSSK